MISRCRLHAAYRAITSGTDIFALVAALVITAALWSCTLRNDGTPAGDGHRIMPFIEFARSYAHGFAFWNPLRNGGYPLFGDPEHFWLVAQLVNSSGRFANLELNAVFFGLVLISILPAWLIGRRLEFTRFWNVLFVVSLNITGQQAKLHLTGNLVYFEWRIAILCLIWALIRDRRSVWTFAILSLSIGLLFATTAYYALIYCLLVLSSSIFRHHAAPTPERRSSAIVQGAIVAVTGFLLSGAWSIPLLAHFSEAHASPQMLRYSPAIAASILRYAQMLVPHFPQSIDIPGMFISFAVFPAFVLARCWKHKTPLPGLLGGQLVYAWAILYMAMSLPLVGEPLLRAYSAIPVVSGIRWFTHFQFIIEVVVLINVVAILQRHEIRRLSEVPWQARLCLGGFFLLSALSIFASAGIKAPLPGIAAVLLALLGGYTVGGLLEGIKVKPIERADIKALSILLVALTALGTLSQLFLKEYPGLPKATYTSNRSKLPELERIVAEDGAAYLRFFSDVRGDDQLLLAARKRATRAFSLYFPEGLSYTLGYLSRDYQIDRLRPDWAGRVPCRRIDPRALDLLAVKYMFCEGDDGLRLPGWEFVAEENQIRLFRRAGYDGGIHVFCKWISTPNAPPREARDGVLGAYAAGVALVAGTVASGSDAPCAAEGGQGATVKLTQHGPDRMTLAVSSRQPVVIVIPDNFDRRWVARIGGQAVPVLKAYHAYLGVLVPAGDNTIELSYRDIYFWLGVLVSSLTLVGLGIYVWLRPRRLQPR